MSRRAIRTLLVFAAVGAHACGKVERDSNEDPPCDRYCDLVIDECAAPMERLDCDFYCDCMHDTVRPEVSDDFVECLAGLPCDATMPEQICAMTVAARLEGQPSAEVVALIDDCTARVDELGGCPKLQMPCEAAAFVVDSAVPALRDCLTAPDCAALDECVGSAFFLGCMDPGV